MTLCQPSYQSRPNFRMGKAGVGREQDAVGVVEVQALDRLQRLVFQEQGGQHAQRGLIGCAQSTRGVAALERVSPELFGDRSPGDDAPYAPVFDFVEHGHKSK